MNAILVEKCGTVSVCYELTLFGLWERLVLGDSLERGQLVSSGDFVDSSREAWFSLFL